MGLEIGIGRLVDPCTGERQGFLYFGFGPGYGAGVAVTAEGGLIDLGTASDAGGIGVVTGGFLAAGPGISASVITLPDQLIAGGTYGFAGGVGGGVSSLLTYTYLF